MQHVVLDSKEKLRIRFSNLSLIFVFISFLFFACIITVAAGIFFFGFDSKWAALSLDVWIYLSCIFVLFFIILEIALYLTYNLSRNDSLELKKQKQEYINNKRVLVYTCPKQAEGGIFSKTYIPVDQDIILRIRCLMVPPGELWCTKEDITL